MTATDSSDPEGAPQALWLIRTGIVTAIAMALALIGASWTMFLMLDQATTGAIAGLLCGNLAALAGAYLIHQIIRDLAQREKSAAREAGHDLLSGLANRKRFSQWIDYELARHRREHVHFALMYLDIDHFKDINDRHGHDTGDRMIRAVSQRIGDTLRPTDRLARFGGDEFAILQTGVRTMRDAEALASRIVESMRPAFQFGRLEMGATVSIGIALCPDNATERDDLMKLADLALYRAKKEGRNRFAFFDARMGEDLARRRQLGVELAAAIEHDGLALDFQPVYCAADRRIVGTEARVRWPHPERGMMNAAEFTSIAEERGLVLPLGGCALRKACATALGWNDLRLSVNVAPVQLNHRDFAAQVLHILHDTGFDPARLDLCLGEDCILEPKDAAVAGMALLRQEGVRLTLTGYGAGVAGMNYVRRFPFTRIKLDRTCADASPSMTGAAAVLHSVIHLGRALGLTVTADGVDSEEQARTLTALGCHELQGRLLSRYVSAAELEQIVAASANMTVNLA